MRSSSNRREKPVGAVKLEVVARRSSFTSQQLYWLIVAGFLSAEYFQGSWWVTPDVLGKLKNNPVKYRARLKEVGAYV